MKKNIVGKAFSLLVTILLVSNSIGIASATPDKAEENGYWTLAKMKTAHPFEMQFDSKTHLGKREVIQNAKKQPPPSDAVTGSPWTQSGLAQSATGKVFFTMGIINYVCSGALVKETDTARSIVLTAGHCVYDPKTGIADNWMFVPDYDALQLSPFSSCDEEDGCWYADKLLAHTGFTDELGFTDTATMYDWGFAVIQSDGATPLPDKDGANAFTLDESGLSENSQGYSFGYPAAGKYRGSDLIYCKGNVFSDSKNNDATWGMVCDMTGGSSGGPWLSDFVAGDGKLSSLNSYKYTNDRRRMYGRKFDSNTRDTFEEALAWSNP